MRKPRPGGGGAEGEQQKLEPYTSPSVYAASKRIQAHRAPVGVVSVGELLEWEAARWRSFWTCPASGRDCRYDPQSYLAIIRDGRSARFQMFRDEQAAHEETPFVIACAFGMTSDYILDVWLHYSEKNWIGPAELNEVFRKIAWHYGDRSWAWRAGSRPKVAKTPRPSPAIVEGDR